MMLTSFFGKSSPINFLLLGIFIFLVTVFQQAYHTNFQYNLEESLLLLAGVFLLIFSMLLLDFIIRKNKLTQTHTLGILIFSCVALIFPHNLELNTLLAQIFLLFALRRIFSLTSDRNIEKKIFDASLWILLASYFYFWSILMIILLVIAISYQSRKELRYFFIPFITFIGLFLIASAFFYVKEDSFRWFSAWPESISFNYTNYGSPIVMIGITLLLTVFVWSFIHQLNFLSEVPKKSKANYKLVMYASVICLFMIAFAEEKSGEELLYLAAPMALVIASYLERKGESYLKEAICWAFVLLPLLAFYV
jgi:Family of unknown function (DUF6427)